MSGFQRRLSVKTPSDPEAERRSYCRSSIIEDGKKMKLLCGEHEPERRYHGVWLRHNCRCPQCLSPSTNQNVVPYENLIDLEITNVFVEGQCSIIILLLLLLLLLLFDTND